MAAEDPPTIATEDGDEIVMEDGATAITTEGAQPANVGGPAKRFVPLIRQRRRRLQRAR